MPKRVTMDEPMQFLYRNFGIMMTIYRSLMEKGVPPDEGRLIFLVMAEIEQFNPESNDEFVAAVQRVLDRERKTEQ